MRLHYVLLSFLFAIGTGLGGVAVAGDADDACGPRLGAAFFTKVAERSRRDRAAAERELKKMFEDLVTAPAVLRPADEPSCPPRTSDSRHHCFLGHMRVSTPRGLVRIDALRRGDLVFSYDLETGSWTTSRVGRIGRTRNQSYGTLKDLAVPIDVTAEHRFYARGRGFQNVGTLAGNDVLLRLVNADLKLHEVPTFEDVARGDYELRESQDVVYELYLEEGPHNYFVEGILVHNVKETS